MRSAVSVAILVSTSFLLAGCADGGDDDHLHFECADGTEIHEEDHPGANITDEHDLEQFCPGSSTGTRTNTTTQAPNVLPVLVLTVSDDGGNATKVTMLDGNLTFSAEGSTDPDGTIAGIAVTVTDSNTTRTATLYDTARSQFKSATFKFDRAGVINVTVAMVDDRAGFTVNQTKVYVNQVVEATSQDITFPRPPQSGPVLDDCAGGGEDGAIYEAQFFKVVGLAVAAGVTKIEAVDDGDVLMSICSPAETSLSGAPANPAVTTPDAVMPPPVGIESYFVAAYATAPSADFSPTVTIHYEPQTDAAPAE